MSYDLTASIKPAIERMLNLGAKFCVDLAVKVGVFRGRTVALIERSDDAGSRPKITLESERQIMPEHLGGGNGYNKLNLGYINSGYRRTQWRATSDTVIGVQEKERMHWFVNMFKLELNKIIPDEIKYLREKALEDAYEIFDNAFTLGKTKEEAMKVVLDSNILTKYSKLAEEKIASNKLLDQLIYDSNTIVKNHDVSEML